MVLRFLFHVGRAVANQGVSDIAKALADPTYASAGDLMGKIAFGAWAGLRAEKKQDRLNADILDAAKMDFAEIKRQAVEIAAQVAPNDPVMRDHVERFVTLVPASIVASLKRADDPTGTTLPYNYVIEDESDIVKLLPVRFPRAHFRPGYAPPFLRGWELVTQLGAGGFGEVWQVRNLRTTNLVRAVKFGHALNDAELSLLNEGDVLNRLLAHGKHAGIVELHGVWADGDEVPWLMYEYVPGGDLTGLMRTWAALPMEQRLPKVLAAFRELCETVGHFHRLSPAIVHRDLKPSNILVTADDKLKVGDFGIGSVSAKRTLDGERRGTLSRTNTVQAYLRGAHTPLYAPPEQKTDPKHRPQPTDDVHALGVILYQMLTGKLDAAPGARFDRELEMMKVPQPLIDAIGDCVEPDKAKRPADAGAILAKLAPQAEPVLLIAAPDLAKEAAERRAIEQAERAERLRAKQERERAEREATEARRKRELEAERQAAEAREKEQQRRWQLEAERERRANVRAERRRTAARFLGKSALALVGLAVLAAVGYGVYFLAFLRGISPEWTALKVGTKAGEEVTLPLGNSGVTMAFCWCPPGTFQRGSNDTEDEKPVRHITISKGFWMAKYETTQAQWTALGFKNESNWKGDTLPVEMVTHTQAVAFADKLKSLGGKEVRLPTEAEWEYACRAGTPSGQKYWSGNTNADLAAVGWYDGNSGSKTHPVGEKNRPNPWGLHDMHGNAWEWCSDWYDTGYYAKSPTTDPTGPESGLHRVSRGGSWSYSAWYCRAAYRSRDSPGGRNGNLGFRLAAVPSGPSGQ